MSSGEPRARLLCIVSDTAQSPYRLPRELGGDTVSWAEAAEHLSKRVSWTEPTFVASSVTTTRALDPDAPRVLELVAAADVVVFLGVTEPRDCDALAQLAAAAPCVLAFDCSPTLAAQQRLHYMPSNLLAGLLSATPPWARENKDAKLLTQTAELVARKLPNDFVFALLLILDSCVAPLTTMTMAKPTGPGTLFCMARNCGSEVLACVNDPVCKRALDCLTDCGLNDQVCSYRCIVSYETPKFETFSLCVLQKHNCLGNFAQRPMLPHIQPMAVHRGEALTHDRAEALLAGWLSGAGLGHSLVGDESKQLPWSWRVAAGQNPAFDHFPAQHQLYYKKGRSMWYDPVFAVETLDGKWEWRRRHYRVKRGTAPGLFTYSVLDNGVTSLEYWTLVDADDDLAWALFAYSGAAESAGQAYSGAVLCTPTGAWPAAEQLPRVAAAHARCGIAMWETYSVDNSEERVRGAPLGTEEAVPA